MSECADSDSDSDSDLKLTMLMKQIRSVQFNFIQNVNISSHLLLYGIENRFHVSVSVRGGVPIEFK